MKRTTLATLCCLLLAAGGAWSAAQPPPVDEPSRFERIQRAFMRPDGETVLVVAHRGAHKRAPENSLAAVRDAITLGVDLVELDLQRTRDGHLVILHDPTVDRTTDGHGLVAAMTLDQLKKLRLRMPDGTLTEERVPTLEETMQFVRGKCMVNLDRSFRRLDEVVDVLVRTRTVDHAIVKGPAAPDTVRRALGRHDLKLLYMPQVHSAPEMKLWLRDATWPAFEIAFPVDALPIARPETLRTMRDSGARVWVSTMFPGECAGLTDRKALEDPDAAWGRLVDLGVDMIQTDEPEALLKYLRKRGKHR